MWTIAGLGNPGEKYVNTRHNVGFMVLDALAGDSTWVENSNKSLLYVWKKLGKEKIELVKPLTFMNKSGSAVKLAQSKHKTKPEQIIIVHDDIDLPFGTLKISFGRGSGGHKGVESVRKALKTKDFVRVRVGVCPTTPKGKFKKPVGEEKVYKFLLGEFSKKEVPPLKKIVKEATKAAETIVTEGKTIAMNRFN